MHEVLAFLKECGTFYLATIDGDQPRVRPFGLAMEFDGRLCFCTNNQKEVYKQMQANPNIEISATSKTGQWLRLRGKAVFNTTRASRQAALDTVPSLKSMYSVDDAIFEIFYIDNAIADICSFGGPKKTYSF